MEWMRACSCPRQSIKKEEEEREIKGVRGGGRIEVKSFQGRRPERRTTTREGGREAAGTSMLGELMAWHAADGRRRRMDGWVDGWTRLNLMDRPAEVTSLGKP